MTANDKRDNASRCARCGAAFECGAEAGKLACWCQELPRVMPVPAQGAGCYCPDCLRAVIAREQVLR